MDTPLPSDKKILVADDDAMTLVLLPAGLASLGAVEVLDTRGMDVAKTVGALRDKLKNVGVLILDGQFADPSKTGQETAVQIIQALSTELTENRICVIVYSADETILTAIKDTFQDAVTTVRKGNGYKGVLDAIKVGVPFKVTDSN